MKKERERDRKKSTERDRQTDGQERRTTVDVTQQHCT